MSAHTYYMDDGTISVPPGFRDRTVNALEWQTEDGDRLALIVQRAPRPEAHPGELPSQVLSGYVAAETHGYPAQFAGYHVEREEASGEGSPFEVIRKAFRWRSKEDVLYHHQAFVLLGGAVLTLTCAGKARHREAVDRLLDDALADLRARAD